MIQPSLVLQTAWPALRRYATALSGLGSILSSYTVVSDVDVAVDGYGYVGFWTAYDAAGAEVAHGRCPVAVSTREAALLAADRQASLTLKDG